MLGSAYSILRVSQQENKGVRNSISFDLEHWYTATLLVNDVVDPVDRIVESTDIVLDLLDRHDVTSTFFVVGHVAEEYPWLIRKIHDQGHEIGSHGQTHKPLFDLSPAEFERELTESGTAIEAATGEYPLGVRMPNFSLTRQTKWGFDILAQSDYRYDSSVFPMKTPMYGVSGGPIAPYWVNPRNPFDSMAAVEADERSLVECPLAVTNTFPRIPVAGGFYARVSPVKVLSWGIQRLNRAGIPANLYFHPWEFNPDVPVSEPRLYKRVVSFSGIDRLADKVERLLTAFEFGSVSDTIRTALGPNALELQESRTSKNAQHFG